MSEHIGLGRPTEGSIYPAYKCRVCGEDLWIMKGADTNWKEWLFTKDNRRHYKTRCNLTPKQEATDE